MPKKDPKIIHLRNELGAFFTIDDLEDFDLGLIKLCVDKLEEFEDTRQLSKIEYKLSSVVMLVILCTFADINEWKKMEKFAKIKQDIFMNILDFPEKVPSHDTMQRVFALINPKELTDLLMPLFAEVVNSAVKKLDIKIEDLYKDEETTIKDIYAFDGKEIRKTGNKYKDGEDMANFNSLNVYSTEYQLAIKAERIESKTNEIPVMSRVMKYLDLKGVIATFDALNTQKTVVASIVDARGDYVGVLKKNHGVFYKELEDYFDDIELLDEIKKKDIPKDKARAKEDYVAKHYLVESEETKRNLIQREYFITDDISWFYDLDEWKGLKSIGYELKTTKKKDTGEVIVSKRYFLNSIKEDVNLFALSVRRHWNIENNLHWHLDFTFKEDYVTTKNKAALHNLTIVRRFVLAVLNLVKEVYGNVSLNMIRSQISWSFEEEIKKIFTMLIKLLK
ncbi:MAG: ISAs1 family transposase [Bacilli bacterium]|nr:ISAs1 family transposase [Bacilli bacterium]